MLTGLPSSDFPDIGKINRVLYTTTNKLSFAGVRKIGDVGFLVISLQKCDFRFHFSSRTVIEEVLAAMRYSIEYLRERRRGVGSACRLNSILYTILKSSESALHV